MLHKYDDVGAADDEGEGWRRLQKNLFIYVIHTCSQKRSLGSFKIHIKYKNSKNLYIAPHYRVSVCAYHHIHFQPQYCNESKIPNSQFLRKLEMA